MQKQVRHLREESLTGGDLFRTLTNYSWVHRRVERVGFVDESTVLRQTSVDFTLPLAQTKNFRRLHPGVVPVGLLKKRALSRFSLWDEDGRALVMFTTEQNGYLAAAVLVAAARFAKRDGELVEPVPLIVLDVLRAVARQPTAKAEVLFRCLRDGVETETASSSLKALEDRRDEDNSELRELVRKLEPHDEIARQLMQTKELAGLAEELSAQFIVCTQLAGGDGRPDVERRRLVKYAYEEPPTSYASAGKSFRHRVSGFVYQAGLWPEKRTLDSVPVGSAGSYHVEVEAPDDIELVGASLLAEDPGITGDTPKRSRARGAELQRVHLHVTGAPRAYSGPVWVQFRAVRSGFLTAALVTAWLIAALLHLGEPRLPSLQNSELEASAALLVALPTILAAFLLRSGEHQLASRLLRGPRLLLLGSAACCLASAGALAGGYNLADRQCYWATAADVAFWLAIAQSLTYFAPYLPQMGGWLARKTSEWPVMSGAGSIFRKTP